MILLFCYLTLIVVDLFANKSKFVTVLNFILMWILMGWCTSNADYMVYYNRYNYPQYYPTLEFLYSALQNLFRNFNADYNMFLICMSLLFLLVRYFIILKSTDKPNLLIAFWLIFPFVVECTQLRTFYATSVVYLGIYLLFKSSKHNKEKFIISIVIATLIHAAMIIYLILIIPYVYKGKVSKLRIKIWLTTFVLVLLLISGILLPIVTYVANIIGIGAKFIETYLANTMQYSTANIFGYIIEMIVLYILVFLWGTMACNSREYLAMSLNKTKFINWALENNDLLMITIPLVFFTGDIYRIQQWFLPIIGIANIFIYDKKIDIRKVYVHDLLLLGTFIIFAYLMELSLSSLRETVFLPLFFANGLI